MKIKVIGKAHLQGTSKKSGKDYNFVQVHYNAPARGVIGEAAQTLMLDPAFYPVDAITVGATYDAQFDNRGYVVAFDYVSSK